jgi:hypothetical protein
MSDERDVSSKVKRAAAAVGGVAFSGLLAETVVGAPVADSAEQQPVTPEEPPQDNGLGNTTSENASETPHSGTHEYVPESGTSETHHNADGSVGASTGTTWRPDGTETQPAEDLPTIEEFEEIEVREDAFGNFVIDATERVVVHNHGHDEVFEDHQHLVVPGDGTPGDTDLDIIERDDVVVHENPDGSFWVEQHDAISVETHPDAPGHGDIEVWQVESVGLDDAETGPPGIEVGIGEGEQAFVADDPFGDPTTIHQEESVSDRERSGTVSATSSTSPSVPTSVAFARGPSTMDSTGAASTTAASASASASAAAAAETGQLAAATSLAADHTAAPRHTEPVHHDEPHPSFATEPTAERHDPGELTGPPPVPDITPHPVDTTGEKHSTENGVPQVRVDEKPLPQPETPVHEQPDHHLDDTAPAAHDVPDHQQPIHHVHGDGGGIT